MEPGLQIQPGEETSKRSVFEISETQCFSEIRSQRSQSRIPRCTGGEVGATSALAPKIGTLVLSPKKFGDDIAKATGDWKGLRIALKLTIQNRQAQIDVVPSASVLIIKGTSRNHKRPEEAENY
ncbi:60S ribosomal protein L12 [Galemys pyrenaicus]|uniref:60S ribosomal protein L12 n=1 Tax=Galemys pyrenaicus TaxID=202257 RepID=A0A8J6ALD8_GALPY|nr:60S ribosomal protein L12 [Galemys pyrenaicus]